MTEKITLKISTFGILLIQNVEMSGFLATQILDEINSDVSESSKTAIFALVEDLNFDFYEFWHFLKAEMYPIQKLSAPRIAKMAFFEHLHSPKLISRKI